jgi:hypothetical protein
MGKINDAGFLAALTSLAGDDRLEVRENAERALSPLKQPIEAVPGPEHGK